MTQKGVRPKRLQSIHKNISKEGCRLLQEHYEYKNSTGATKNITIKRFQEAEGKLRDCLTEITKILNNEP